MESSRRPFQEGSSMELSDKMVCAMCGDCCAMKIIKENIDLAR
jgi:uncharacterized cysteine cluster protein YcgN (CxxCxxCC family)